MGVASVLLFALLIGFLVTLAIVIVIVLAIRRRREVPHPSCGQCRYAVAGLETLTCPECGADLRTVGILTPGVLGATWLVPLLVAVLWTLLVFVVGTVGINVARRMVPTTYQSSSTWVMSARADFDPVTFTYEGAGRVANAAHRVVTLTAAPRDGTRHPALTVVLPDLLIDGDANRPLTSEAIAAWLRRDRETRTPADLDLAGQELLKHIKAGMTMGGLTISGPSIYFGGSISSQSMPQPRPGWFLPLVLGTWTAVWLLGLGLIIWRARRRLPGLPGPHLQ